MNANTDAMKNIRGAFERASRLAQAGDWAMAESACRETLQRFPQENNLSCLLGAVLIRQQRAAEAETLLRSVVARVPDFAKAHDELANALLAQNLPEQAVESLRRVIELDPDNPLARAKLGEIRTVLGDSAERSEEDPAGIAAAEGKLLKAAQHRDAGQLREAEALYQAVLATEPDNARVYQLLGNLAVLQRQFGDAEILFKRAVTLDPENVSAWLDLGVASSERDGFEAAADAVQRAIAIEPGSSLSHQLLGGVYNRAGQYESAVSAFSTAVELQSDNAAALLGLGHTQRAIGNFDDAIAAYRRLIAAHQDAGEAYWSLANLKSYRFSADETESMLGQVDRDDVSGESRVCFCFALGKAFEDEDDFDRAFKFFERGNKIKRKSETYDPVETQAMTERLLAVFDRSFVTGAPDSAATGAVPIFIVGMPRSGSTLVEQILASHSQVAGTRELSSLDRVARSLEQRDASRPGYPDVLPQLDTETLTGLGERYLAATKTYRDDSPYFTDKMPNNFRHAGLISLILPEARIVDIRRHPLDSCMGCFKQLFAGGQPFSYDLFEMGEYYLEYSRLMQHWDAVLPGKVLTVMYEDLVADLEGQVQRLLNYCGLPMEQACLNFHETERPIESASSEQVRQPIYGTAVNQWRNYEPHLDGLIETLQPVLD